MEWNPSSSSLDIESLHHQFLDGLTLNNLFEAIWDRVHDYPDKSVWISICPREEVWARLEKLEQAWEGSATLAHFPLFGIPFAVKDNLDVAGYGTTAACPAFAYEAKSSHPAVELLEAAGAVLIGKTNMDQFATGLVGTRSPYGTVVNAFDAEFIAGGSSSGSAVAVAAGLVSFALGTDTAGSGRIPAAFNNVVGLKPTRGLLSTRGVVPACRSLDCVSVFALTCGDAFRVFHQAQAFDPKDPFSREVPPERQLDCLAFTSDFPRAFRFGIPEPGALPQGEYGTLFRGACERLIELGGAPLEIPFAPFDEAAKLLYQGPWLEERRAAFGDFVREHPEDVLPVIRQVLDSAGPFSAEDAFRAQYRLHELRSQIRALFQTVDCLCLPTAPDHFTLAEVDGDPLGVNARLGRYTNFVNLLDLSALAVPSDFTADHLPFGVTLIGPAFHDGWLASLGSRLHSASGLPMGTTSHPVPETLPLGLENGMPRLAVVGLHLSGQPLNHQLRDLGARRVRATRTVPNYRLYALTRGDKTIPGLVRQAMGGHAIEVEVWEITLPALGVFLGWVREPLCLGTVELEDGEKVKGFLCEAHAVENAKDKSAEDISRHGGWLAYLQSGL